MIGLAFLFIFSVNSIFFELFEFPFFQNRQLEDISYDPVAFFERGKNSYFLDQSEGKVKVVNGMGLIIREFGQRGQGPGEWLIPIDMHLYGEEIFVFDADTGKVLKFDLDGQYLGGLQLMRGYGISFGDDGMVVRVIINKHSFHYFDLKGNKLSSFGDGWTRSMYSEGLFEALLLESKATIDGQTGLYYVVYTHGRKMETYQLPDGELVNQYDLNLSRFAAKREEKMNLKGIGGVFSTKNGEPVKDIIWHNRYLWVLLQDEHEKAVSYFAVFDEKGQQRGIKRTSRFFTRMLYHNAKFSFFNQEDGILARYRVEWIK